MAPTHHCWIALGCAAGVGLSGCAPTTWPVFRPSLQPVDITIAAEAVGQGEFELTGSAPLPDATVLTVAALRYLQPPQALGPTPTYTILDWQNTAVTDGQWATRLTLSHTAADGSRYEPWQALEPPLQLQATPGEQVKFLVVLPPGAALDSLTPQLRQAGYEITSALVHTTETGEAFLQAETVQTLPPPPSSAALAAELPANGGWGERYRLVSEPPLPYELQPEDTPQTTAPGSPTEFLF